VDMESSYELHLSATARQLFQDDLIGMVSTDSYLRQPDFSSRVRLHYYLVLHDGNERSALYKARYLQNEFPDAVFNLSFRSELECYPAHGVWQFTRSPWILLDKSTPLGLRDTDVREEIRQCVFATSHLSRLYFLRNLSPKTHTWGVRQFGWAVRYAEHCLTTGSGNTKHVPVASWLKGIAGNWSGYEGRLLDSVDAFREAASTLSGLSTVHANLLQSDRSEDCFFEQEPTVADNAEVQLLVDEANKALRRELGVDVLSFYLHGSAARGDMRPGSDVDTFLIVGDVSHDTLNTVRKIQAKLPPLTISVYARNEINQYPKFRRYALTNGIKHIGGDWAIQPAVTTQDELNGVLNNIFTVRQMARSYLISGSYGPRASYVAGLMSKLTDHGCLRPLQRLNTGTYPATRSHVRQSLGSSQPALKKILNIADTLKQNDSAITSALLGGDSSGIEDQFFTLLQASVELEVKYDQASGVISR
jgi:predicted nucleotidyltransferase